MVYKNFLDNGFKDSDIILLNGNINFGKFYIIKKSEDKDKDFKKKENDEYKIDEDEEEFVNDIITFVILIYSFNLEIKENFNKKRFHYNQNKSKNSLNGCLFNENEFNKFKQIINFEELLKLIQNLIKTPRINENDKNSILEKIRYEKDGYFTQIILKKMIIKN